MDKDLIQQFNRRLKSKLVYLLENENFINLLKDIIDNLDFSNIRNFNRIDFFHNNEYRKNKIKNNEIVDSIGESIIVFLNKNTSKNDDFKEFLE